MGVGGRVRGVVQGCSRGSAMRQGTTRKVGSRVRHSRQRGGGSGWVQESTNKKLRETPAVGGRLGHTDAPDGPPMPQWCDKIALAGANRQLDGPCPHPSPGPRPATPRPTSALPTHRVVPMPRVVLVLVLVQAVHTVACGRWVGVGWREGGGRALSALW